MASWSFLLGRRLGGIEVQETDTIDQIMLFCMKGVRPLPLPAAVGEKAEDDGALENKIAMIAINR